MRELIERRSLKAKHFELDNGTYQAIVTIHDQHYHNKDTGTLDEIDTNWEYENGFGHKVKKCCHNLRVFGRTLRFGFDRGVFVDYTLPKVNSPIIAGSQLRIVESWDNTELEYQATPEGIKGDIILVSTGHPLSFNFPIMAVNCVPVVEGNMLVFYRNSTPIGRIPAPYMTDANGSEGAVTLSFNGDSVTFTPDANWLSTAVYPVKLDPSTTIQPDGTTGQDTYVSAPAPTTNYGTNTLLLTGYSAGNYRSIIQFDLSSIPVSSKIALARFEAYQATQSTTNSFPFSVHEVTSSWDETTAQWDLQPSFDPSEVAVANLGVGSVWYYWDITTAVVRWVNSIIPNYGFIIKRQTENTSTSRKSFNSSDFATTPSLRPKLTIDYTSEAGTQIVESFSSTTLGQPPVGWSNLWGTTTVSEFSVQSIAGSVDGKALYHNPNSVLGVMVKDSVGMVADGEVLMRFMPSTSASQNLAIYFRATNNQNYYKLILGLDSSYPHALQKVVSFTNTPISSSSTPVLTVGLWYWVRLSFIGRTIQYRIWADGEIEPSTWITNIDSSLTSGYIGLGGNTGSTYVDTFGVGTGMKSAVSGFGITILKIITDTVSTSEAFNKIKGLIKSVNEGIMTSEVVQRGRKRLRQFSEGLNITDIHSRILISLGVFIVKVISEGINILDIKSRLRYRIKAFTEGVSVSEERSRFRSILKFFNDQVDIVEGKFNFRSITKIVTDNLAMLENHNWSRKLLRIITDGLNTLEEVFKFNTLRKVLKKGTDYLWREIISETLYTEIHNDYLWRVVSMAKVFILGEEKECAVELYNLDKSKFNITSATYKVFDIKGATVLEGTADIAGKKVYTTIKPTSEGRFYLIFECVIQPLLLDGSEDTARATQLIKPKINIVVNNP